MRLQLNYYGKLTEAAGCESEVIETTPAVTAMEIKNLLIQRYPEIIHVPLAFFVFNKILEQNDRLTEDSCIDCMPPFSGG